MRLADLVEEYGAEAPVGDLDIDVSDLTHDSRAVSDGTVFACVRGSQHDGHEFATAAVDAGAGALLVDHRLGTSVPEIVVPDVREAMGPMASVLHGRPSTRMAVVGVTGTNGKTTVTHLLGGILEAAGLSPVVLGTLSGARTTPEGPDLQRLLASALDEGTRAVAMEVSSHALALHRVDGTEFVVSVFTNLGQDHLDFHADFEDYFSAKARLFDRSFTRLGVVCRDDPWGRRLLADAGPDRCEMRSYGADDVSEVTLDARGSNFVWDGHRLRVHLPGRHNLLNAIAAATVADAMAIDGATIAAGLDTVTAVRGRFEPVDSRDGATDVDVIVDYAHKPDALEAVLRAARELTSGRVVVVVGAGGDRDRAKRPVMGALASSLADVAYITNDNPRSEDPQVIIDEILAGIDDPASVVVDQDRAAAIRRAVLDARAGDVVVIAGKGHEATQTTGDLVVDFDDADHASRALVERATRA